MHAPVFEESTQLFLFFADELQDDCTLHLLQHEGQTLPTATEKNIMFTPHYDTLIKSGTHEYYSENQKSLPYALAELVDNSLSATARNKGLRRIEIRLIFDKTLGKHGVLVLDNGCGMTSEQLNNWAVYRLSKFTKQRNKFTSEKEGYVRPDHIHRSLNSDISYFGVGGKHAAFFIGDSVRMISKPRDSPYVHELLLSKEEFKRKEQSNQDVFSGTILNRMPGVSSHITKDERFLHDVIQEESEKQSFTVVVITGIIPDHIDHLKEDFEEWTRELAHIYHYYIHGANGNVLSQPRDPSQRIDIVTLREKPPKALCSLNLREVNNDMQTLYINSAADTFEFQATPPGDDGFVEGVLRYHPFLYDKETYPKDPSSDDDDCDDNESEARGKRDIFECFWNGRLVPYTTVSEFDWCSRPKKSCALPAECFSRLSGVLFTNDKFAVSTNKLKFMELELKLRNKETIFTPIFKDQVTRNIEKEFMQWLQNCHERYDKQVKFFGFTKTITRTDGPGKQNTPWGEFSAIEWDGKIYRAGQLVRKKTPTLYGTVVRFLLCGEYDGDIFATGGEVEFTRVRISSSILTLTTSPSKVNQSQILNISILCVFLPGSIYHICHILSTLAAKEDNFTVCQLSPTCRVGIPFNMVLQIKDCYGHPTPLSSDTKPVLKCAPHSLHVKEETVAVENGSPAILNVEIHDEAGNLTANPKQLVVTKPIQLNITGGEPQMLQVTFQLLPEKVPPVVIRLKVVPSSRVAQMEVYSQNECLVLKNEEKISWPAGGLLENLCYRLFDERGVEVPLTAKITSKIKVNWTRDTNIKDLVLGKLPEIPVPTQLQEERFCQVSYQEQNVSFSFIIFHLNHLPSGFLQQSRSSVAVTGVRFHSGPLGPRELCFHYSSFEERVIIKMTAGDPAELKLISGPEQPLQVLKGQGIPTPFLLQLCDEWGNPSPDQRVVVEIASSRQSLKPYSMLMPSTVQSKTLSLTVIPDPNKPVKLSVEYNKKAKLFAGGTFPGLCRPFFFLSLFLSSTLNSTTGPENPPICICKSSIKYYMSHGINLTCECGVSSFCCVIPLQIASIEQMISEKTAEAAQFERAPRRVCSIPNNFSGPDVLGVVGHLALIEDDEAARVISWHLRGDMDCVITRTTEAARSIYADTHGNQQVMPLDSISNYTAERPLPHTKNGRALFAPAGNPVYARHLLICPKEKQICDTGEQISVGAGAFCPTILTRDGNRVSAKGKFGGSQNKAPRIEGLQVFSAPFPKRYYALKEETDMLLEYFAALTKKEKAEEEQRNHLKTLESPEMMQKQEQVTQMKMQLQEIEKQLGEIFFCPAAVMDGKNQIVFCLFFFLTAPSCPNPPPPPPPPTAFSETHQNLLTLRKKTLKKNRMVKKKIEWY
uniref:Structural maintenance of chromosomes flexible hinge domain containing 1 n=1 Tax=Oryzias latipes TaxID=8090 RepID=H2M6M6_ORYLA